MRPNWLKIASFALTLAGGALGLASNYVGDKLLDIKVAEEVAKALSKK